MCINFSIVYRLRRRPPSQHHNLNERRRRTNTIIVAVTCIFFISWLPFNIFNIAIALNPNTFLKVASEKIVTENKMAFSNDNALGKGFCGKGRVDRNSVEAWPHQSDRQAAYILDPPIVAFAGFLLVGLEICMQR